jgi:hypothetical protein
MGKRIRCFMLERTDEFQRYLRRFTFGSKPCPSRGEWGHDASVDLDIVTLAGEELEGTIIRDVDRDDPRWPLACEKCGYEFTSDDEWQSNTNRLYRMPDGSLTHPADAPAGAMWFVPWYDAIYTPQLEHCLVVKLPGGHDWVVDSCASNCTMPDDRRQERHHCWVISGTLPDVTAGKDGPTCAAGAGSIAAPGYHGFLRGGYLEEC